MDFRIMYKSIVLVLYVEWCIPKHLLKILLKMSPLLVSLAIAHVFIMQTHMVCSILMPFNAKCICIRKHVQYCKVQCLKNKKINQ